MKASNELKAWCVAGDEFSEVVFATTGVVARREGAAQLDEDFRNVTCRRAPDLDGYAARGRVSLRVLTEEHAWWTSCRWCGRKVSREQPHRRWADDDSVWCSTACEAHEADHDRDRATEEAEEERALAGAVTATEETFPGITRLSVQRSWRKDLCVYFCFPGGQHRASWCPGADTVSVVPGDEQAFRAYLGGLRREAT